MKKIITGVFVLFFLTGFVLFFLVSTEKIPLNEKQTNDIIKIENQNMSNDKKITFNNQQFKTVSNEKEAITQTTDYLAESYEWYMEGEAGFEWSQLITTHKLSQLENGPDITADMYSNNVLALQKQNGAYVFETSLISEDLEVLGIDTKYPPFLIAYTLFSETEQEVNIQKIVDLGNGKVGVIVYAERIPLKNKKEFSDYISSPEYTQKRIELIKQAFPY